MNLTFSMSEVTTKSGDTRTTGPIPLALDSGRGGEEAGTIFELNFSDPFCFTSFHNVVQPWNRSRLGQKRSRNMLNRTQHKRIQQLPTPCQRRHHDPGKYRMQNINCKYSGNHRPRLLKSRILVDLRRKAIKVEIRDDWHRSRFDKNLLKVCDDPWAPSTELLILRNRSPAYSAVMGVNVVIGMCAGDAGTKRAIQLELLEEQIHSWAANRGDPDCVEKSGAKLGEASAAAAG